MESPRPKFTQRHIKMAPLLAPQLSSVQLLISFLLLCMCPSCNGDWGCENSCGGVPLSYPFGSGWNCGSPSVQPHVNCSNGELLFYTPTGTYEVQSIDYTNNVMVVVDPQMSTCSSMQRSGGFGLPEGAPFSFASYDKIALIGCSSTSSLHTEQSCDPDSQQICQSLYSCCSGISQLGIEINSPSSSCCVYSNSSLNTAPYVQIDLPLLQCVTYTSIYHIGSFADPQSSWWYGIALQFPGSYSQPSNGGEYSSCYVCQQAEESYGSLGAVPLGAVYWTAGLTMLVGAFL